jgi:hypothetical protein
MNASELEVFTDFLMGEFLHFARLVLKSQALDSSGSRGLFGTPLTAA